MSLNVDSRLVFQQACAALHSFNIDNKNKIIELDSKDNVTIEKRACWCSRVIRRIIRFFTRGTHPVEKVASRLVDLFTKNQDQVNNTHTSVISKLSFLIGKSQISVETRARFQHFIRNIKIQDPKKVDDEIQRVNQETEKLKAVSEKLQQKASEYNSNIESLKQKIRAELTGEVIKETSAATSKVVSDALEKAKSIRFDARKTAVANWEINVDSDRSELIDEQHQKTCDAILKCKDGKEMFAHWTLMGTCEKMHAPKMNSNGKWELDLQEFSFETVQRFQQLLYKGSIPTEGVFLDDYCDLYKLAIQLGHKKIADEMDSKISVVEQNPENIFILLPRLDKHHPAVNILGDKLLRFSFWNNASEIPAEKKERLLKWILECEDQQYAKLRNESLMIAPLIAYAYLGHLGRVKQLDKTHQILREVYNRPGEYYWSVLTFFWICLDTNIGAPKTDENAKLSTAIYTRLWENNIDVVKYFVAFWAFRKQRSVTMSDKDAFNMIKDMDYSPAQYEAGKCYATSIGDNGFAAESRLKAASDAGHLEAPTALGKLYMTHPYFVKEKSKLGFELITKAAGRNEKEAQYLMGEAYMKGEHVPSDKATAKGWYQKAAAQGFTAAVDALAKLN